MQAVTAVSLIIIISSCSCRPWLRVAPRGGHLVPADVEINVPSAESVRATNAESLH